MFQSLTTRSVFLFLTSIALAQTVAEWEVSGTVATDSGPVKGAYVRIAGAAFSRASSTDAQGRYKLQGALPGLYTVSVQPTENTTEPKARFVRLENGSKLSVDFRLPKGSVLSGRVTNPEGHPIKDVIVVALSKSLRNGRVILDAKNGDKTDDRGSYRIPYLAGGTYYVGAMAKPLTIKRRVPSRADSSQRGFPPVTLSRASRSLFSALPVPVEGGSEHSGLDIVMEPGDT